MALVESAEMTDAPMAPDEPWKRVRVSTVRLLCCLSDVPQPMQLVMADCGMSKADVRDAIKDAKNAGWELHGTSLVGWTLRLTARQRLFLSHHWDALETIGATVL